MKKRFITAYIWLYGTTKKEAERVYKTAIQSYILAVIEVFETNARRTFYEF